ncbi:hypothetical protein BCV70DRAFT_162459 [Testicularia cyperi]|uniref:BZIP domain-containing protein n=1 Tax=Testicularia cyperi TaxID=1882483 RepID=A0A317XMW8_9BASI|nr:hypothetical protein BCV70DRAFT_162459 [Testicularia cyperi]
MPLNHISTSVPPEASGLAASSSPGSSSRTTHSPEDVLKAFSSATHPSDGPISMPLPPSMTSSVKAEPWMNRSSFANDLVGTSQSTIYDAAQASAPSSSTYASKPPASSSPSASNPAGSSAASVPFKTSADRRERNKASQRESRKRKQDRMESLESENAALRKALMDMKKFSEGLSNGAGIKGEDGSEIDPSRLVKFSGAIHLDQIESHLDDETLEPEWKRMVGHRFPASSSNSGDDAEEGLQGASIDSVSGSDEEQDARGDSAVQKAVDGAEDLASLSSATNEDGKVAKSSGPIATSRDSSQQRKKTMWELSLNQRRQKTGSSFPSMVAVPELVLYKVCRLYFSLLLPFTTRLKSGIINLRAARVAPTFFGGCDDLPRFQGDSASDPSAEFYLPPNLMPTESQLRIGFHPVEIAVLPYPSMRDKLLTVLSAFQSIEDVARQAETEARFSPADSSTVIDELEVEDIRTRTALVADMSRWTPQGYVGTMVRPDKSRVYQYGYLEKPKGSHRLQAPAQQWLDAFFLEVVHTLRVWSPAGDVFDPECFEFKESFFRKYPYMVDGQIIRSTNRWRRARGEEPIRL